MTSEFNDFDIPFDRVMDLNPEKCGIIYLVEPGKVNMKVVPKDEFLRYKFELIKWVKKKDSPDDRYFHFETEINGIWSYEKEKRLIEARKSREEKAKELQEERDFKKMCDAMGVEI